MAASTAGGQAAREMPSLAPMIEQISPAVVSIAVSGSVDGHTPRSRRVLSALFRVAARRERGDPKRGLGRNRGCQPRLHSHQSSRRRERRSHQCHAIGQSQHGGTCRRLGCRLRFGRLAGHREQSRTDAVRRLRSAARRRLRHRNRQPVRFLAHRHIRNRERLEPQRHESLGGLRGLHSDRRFHQPRQFRRRARQSQRRARRHQFRDRLTQRRQYRHRLRDPREHGERDHGAADRVRSRQPRIARRQHQPADCPRRRSSMGSATPRALWSQPWWPTRPQSGRASRSKT